MKTIGIFLHGQQGDIMSAMSVLRYRNELWGDDHKIVWYSSKENFDLFKHQDIEVREFPRGFGYPDMVKTENKKLVDAGKEPIWEDWSPLVDGNNQLNLQLKNNFPSLVGIDGGYFPAPHQVPVPKRHGISYPDVSRKVFGISDNIEWHPVLKFSEDEKLRATEFIKNMGEGKRVIIESFAGSGQSRMNEEMIVATMNKCNDIWGKCNFIFASHKFLRDNETFPAYLFENSKVHSSKEFTVRQCALICAQSDLMISVSSGITVAASCWDLPQPPTIQFTGSYICSTRTLAKSHFELVTADDKTFDAAQQEYFDKLEKLLNHYK